MKSQSNTNQNPEQPSREHQILHDLNNCLSTIISSAELLNEEYVDTHGSPNRDLQEILHAGLRGNELIHALKERLTP
ncbi:hypothetical protein [Spirochaeta lutea]|uniref:Signal transduction histidine kinase dimerisation/phosphoacceptor domain-containing protein n=1 Tax=Spirochaeta lutea TaxID=1480694 RepID=A0A098R0H0_9SPIO|nr:hypothetical protein [Spirochaeta lutea]KGE73183.1 hypothetical protein DC28_05275 [Spirochaeta lutea]